MSSVTERIDAHFEETVSKLATWVTQPSVSTEGVGMPEMADLVANDLRHSGYEVSIYQTPGFPIIVGKAGPEGAPKLLIYGHYDVQPAGDPALWSSPAFQPEIRDGKMYGRGVADTKGGAVARLAALDAVREVYGELPVRVTWLLEGEEEIGSPHLDAFVAGHADELRADGCIWEFGTYTWDGTPNVILGYKGMLSIELAVRGPNRDVHSGQAAYFTSPVWRLVWALAAMKTPDGRIRIPGFYDAVCVPTPSQEELIEQMPDDTAQELANVGLTSFLNGMTGKQVFRASAFDPTVNIEGIVSGYTGPGSKTILPSEATAKLDLRLVPEQDPEAIFEALVTFLRDQGFADVEVSRIEGEGDLRPALSDPASPFVKQVIQACQEASGRRPVVVPSSAASGPFAVAVEKPPRGLGVPTAAFGIGYPDTRHHAPNENVRLVDMKAHMYTIARLVEIMGERR